MTRLSIVGVSIPGRAASLAALVAEFERQIGRRNVEVLFLTDNHRLSVGRKRQMVNDIASGEYVVHWGDDDWPAQDYVDSVLAAIESRPDVVTYRCAVYDQGRPQYEIRWSLSGTRNDKVERLPGIVCPLRADIVRQCRYNDAWRGEDFFFRDQLPGKLKTEVHIPRVMYHYVPNFGSRTVEHRRKEEAR